MNTDQAYSAPGGGFYPGLVTARFYETWDFYTELLGFRTLKENDYHVLLEHPSGARLEILSHETDDRHAELVSSADGHGFWFTLEVSDVDETYQRLCGVGVELVHPPETHSQGQRALTVRDPNGVLICLMARRSETNEEMANDCSSFGAGR